MTANTTATIFVLLGLPNVPYLRVLSFVAFLSIYLVTLVGNVVILSAVISDGRLHTPMYYFLANLSFLEMCYTSITVPKILTNITRGINTISFLGCICQMYLFTLCATCECILLAIMAYDRYVAICIPLRYRIIMRQSVCLQLSATAWTSGVINSVIQSLPTSLLQFCDFNQIDRLYCEVQPLLQLSCSDTRTNKVLTTVSASVFGIGFMTFILVSYVFIITAILRIPSLAGRMKAFSTCSSHITVVTLYYGALVFMYLRPTSSNSQSMDSVVSAIYCMAIPVLNPIIYSLRNKDVKRSIKSLVTFRMSSEA
ncbi:olfactory receptor 5V1-like [Spea bombifrons]|uniref:olfactory receptor 5V1-like n=1 Tax=Spea bombifrons TaxID=233779 RepID=UPI00234A4F00|nr:olfactory receptor 5V1-like [Spea bombifrons]